MEDKKSKERKKPLKKGFQNYPLKKATVIGDKLKPIGFKIALNEEGRKFYKQLNII